ncbi:TIM barrel protein [uncultured Tateyamaria sp.]|uniref:sugar phosphate isomerase/epimerase family protein n=1 Tax=uncultured Tateyamaria sp. TaxID=455651 RepID=UPI0026174031|nr:TIM barrel protein [uncultured Tateyamaria sp.]
METCITVWHWPNHDRWYDEGLKETLRLIKKAGFTHINWNPDSGSSYWYAASEIGFIRDTINSFDLKVKTIHASNGLNPVTEKTFLARETRKDIHSPNAWQREAGAELLRNRVDLAAALGSPDMVLHIEVRDEYHESAAAAEAFYTPLFQTLDSVRPYCLEHGIKIAVENLFSASAKTYLQMFDRVFSRYDADFIGLCYDTGHWEITQPGGISVLDQFGDRLICTHIHDNFSACDDHLLPFDGRINWDLVTKGIAATAYETPVNFETEYDRYGLRPSSFYERAHATAVRIETMIQAARSGNAL